MAENISRTEENIRVEIEGLKARWRTLCKSYLWTFCLGVEKDPEAEKALRVENVLGLIRKGE